jgi:hypothetical protein
MDFPYLVNSLYNNLQTINKLKQETEEIIKHIGENAAKESVSGKFKMKPGKNITPLIFNSEEDLKFKSLKRGGKTKKKKPKKT